MKAKMVKEIIKRINGLEIESFEFDEELDITNFSLEQVRSLFQKI